MRKLTDTQQEVLDLINDGWELGSDVTMSGGYWLQKEGIGRGGETKVVSSSTVRTLEYLSYIERGEYSFPILHYRLKTENPTTDPVLVGQDTILGPTYKHPSFGSISFSKAQGSSSVLFGSSIMHRNVITLTICHAEKYVTRGVEHVFGRERIIEAYMSPTQFADAITSTGGGETPITLRFTEKDGRIDNPSFENKREVFEKEFQERVQGIYDRMTDTIEKAKDKRVPQWLVKDLEITQGWFKSNIPYLVEQFTEQMDKTVTEAKAEVEAYVSGMVQQTGLDALEEMRPQLTQGEANPRDKGP